MKFYDALQMDPAVLKREIAACNTRLEKTYYWIAMTVRSVLIVVFAIVFISLLSGVFGADNTPMAVTLFCMMLGIRFVNFEYCVRDSLLTLAASVFHFGHSGTGSLRGGGASASLFDPTAFHGLFCAALYDHPAA